MRLQFPHFSQLKTARFVFSLEMPMLWLALISLIAVNILSAKRMRPAYWNKLMTLFTDPLSVPKHMDLGLFLWNEGQQTQATRLVDAAEQLFVTNTIVAKQIPQNPRVLGITTSPLQTLASWQNEKASIARSYDYWKAIAAAKPDYRDAYISLTVLSFRLGKTDEAHAWLAKAQTIDPNSLTVQKLRNYLR